VKKVKTRQELKNVPKCYPYYVERSKLLHRLNYYILRYYNNLIYATILELLLRPWERWRSIVITSVCLSVCPRGYRRNDTCDSTNFSVHVAYCHGSVLLRQGDEISRQFWGFSSPLTIHCNAFAANNVTHSVAAAG